jgi:hypothetical protein
MERKIKLFQGTITKNGSLEEIKFLFLKNRSTRVGTKTLF